MKFIRPQLKFHLLDLTANSEDNLPTGLYYLVDANKFEKDLVRSTLSRVINEGPVAGPQSKVNLDIDWNKPAHSFRDYVASRNVNYVGRVGLHGAVVWGNRVSTGARISSVMAIAFVLRSIMLLSKERAQLYNSQITERVEEAVKACVDEYYLHAGNIQHITRGIRVTVYGLSSLLDHEGELEMIPIFQASALDGEFKIEVEPKVSELLNAVIDETYFDLDAVHEKAVVEVEKPKVVLKKSSDLTDQQLSMRKVVCAALFDGEVIIAGARHYDSVMHTQLDAIKCDGIKRKWKQGFIDQFGVFLDRKEALFVAVRAKQPIDFERNGGTKELYSEGLY